MQVHLAKLARHGTLDANAANEMKRSLQMWRIRRT
jgi:hypothetical protein